jgi:hypothetical protein
MKLDFPNKEILEKIYSDFNLNDFTEAFLDKTAKEEHEKILNLSENATKKAKALNSYLLDKSNPKEIRNLLKSEMAKTFFKFFPETILFLNFNYTSVHKFYSKSYESLYEELKTTNTDSIQIHGSLIENNNPIIFGYGDEISDDYKMIESLNDNKYLENVKSIKYLETDNYKRLLNFINSDSYQIFIMGHSCGTSDRTLLNTLFEHENCVSIKVFYYRKEDGTDNYSDVIRNISRNFTDKAIMRDKVVNKMYCMPLKST